MPVNSNCLLHAHNSKIINKNKYEINGYAIQFSLNVGISDGSSKTNLQQTLSKIEHEIEGKYK
jgi:hypothetical protein